MSQTSFEVPLVVFSTAPSNVCLINNADEAWSFLIRHWSGNNSPQWLNAMELCQMADLGLVMNDFARASFVVAVRAVGMKVDQSHFGF
ncbi:DUF982 domain-containing protein [Mesorhizobium sp. RP14(2022)]|uniref:DUF982 domain-containing protein n=1 Tax=Mesorhizobium liriopis TaxID=2953882 RepID=A0ABT1CBX6_9HYPH|nr:DUF982 domain-containing protein [Mesorhizobium liriopis]MCO6052342.1 DUF982 domain-containing protein [Mesorhizobium liriopis]